jgi:hypothetical protein
MILSCVNKLRLLPFTAQMVKPKWEEIVEREHGRKVPQNVSGFL